jgi:hypothetical protein
MGFNVKHCKIGFQALLSVLVCSNARSKMT